MSETTHIIHWEERICTAEQREILYFFKLPVRAQLKYKDADRLIEILLRNRTYAKRWDAYENAKFSRKEWFEKNLGYVNDVAGYFGCSGLSMKIFTEATHSLEDRGMTLKGVEDDYERLFQEVLNLHPDLQCEKCEL